MSVNLLWFSICFLGVCTYLEKGSLIVSRFLRILLLYEYIIIFPAIDLFIVWNYVVWTAHKYQVYNLINWNNKLLLKRTTTCSKAT